MKGKTKLKFLELKKNDRTGKVESFKMIEKDEVVKTHPNNNDLLVWACGARLNSRFFITTKAGSYIYVRIDELDERDLPKYGIEGSCK